MRGFAKLILMGIKLYFREFVALFFTIVFAPLMLVLFGSIYGNKPTPFFGGYGTVDIMVPAYIGLIIVTVGLISIPISTASARESKVLKRFRAAPLHPFVYMASELVSYLIVTVLGVLLLVLAGRLIYGARFEGNILSVSAAFLLGSLSIFSLGYLIAALAPTARIAQTVGMAVAFPIMFLSGATIPWELLPQTIRNFSRFLPLTHVVSLMRGLWFGEPWGKHLTEVAVLVGVMAIGGALASLLFRWE